MPKRKSVCRAPRCNKPPYSGGLCQKHSEEETIREERRRVALDALEKGVVGERLPDAPALKEELLRLRVWWFRACDAVNGQRSIGPLPLDEAEHATGWCIALAQEIVDAELALRSGQKPNDRLEYTREWVWDRFKNLEAGLMSNGIPRPANR